MPCTSAKWNKRCEAAEPKLAANVVDYRPDDAKEICMNKIALIAAVLLLGTGAATSAEIKDKTGPGASEASPGDRMQDSGTRGASKYAPGHEMKKGGTYNKMEDKR